MPAQATSTRIALRNVLLTTDFSEGSAVALAYAVAVATEYCGTVVVAHVVSPEPYLSVPLDPLPLQGEPVWQHAQQNMDGLLQSSSWGRTPYHSILRRGELWPVIADVIRTEEIDLLVSATHGRKGLKRLILGSDCEKIYRQAPCPVLTIGPHVAPLSGHAWRPKRILFPTDGSETSLHALPYALSFAEQNEATLTMLRLVPLLPWQYQKAESERSQEALRALVPPEAENWCRPEFLVGFDFPGEGILRVAAERNSELIVMGVRRAAMAGASSHLPWPIASEVVSQATCPVLTVRA